MFIQVIQGKVSDEAGLNRCLDKWERELMPGAVGYLGTTAGMADNGMFVALARFESADAAKKNSERPEQSAWLAEMERCFAGDVTFMDFTQVRPWLSGGSDDAGFVQVMEGRSPDAKRMHDLMQQAGDRIHEARPEIIGGLMAEAGDGRYVDAIYFRSEGEARAGERMEIPDDMQNMMQEEQKLMGEVSYFDLHHPKLVSAK
jgi:hypothetical protein